MVFSQHLDKGINEMVKTEEQEIGERGGGERWVRGEGRGRTKRGEEKEG